MNVMIILFTWLIYVYRVLSIKLYIIFEIFHSKTWVSGTLNIFWPGRWCGPKRRILQIRSADEGAFKFAISFKKPKNWTLTLRSISRRYYSFRFIYDLYVSPSRGSFLCNNSSITLTLHYPKCKTCTNWGFAWLNWSSFFMVKLFYGMMMIKCHLLPQTIIAELCQFFHLYQFLCFMIDSCPPSYSFICTMAKLAKGTAQEGGGRQKGGLKHGAHFCWSLLVTGWAECLWRQHVI